MHFETSAASSEFLTMREVAARLRVSHGGVFNLIKRGSLRHYRFGERILVSEQQLEEFIAGSQRPERAA